LLVIRLAPITTLYPYTTLFRSSIKNAIPTDGLWDAERTDEQQIGATYPELEKIQKEYGTKTESDYTGRDLEVFKIFDRMHKAAQDRKSTRLNSSHVKISYAVFC